MGVDVMKGLGLEVSTANAKQTHQNTLLSVPSRNESELSLVLRLSVCTVKVCLDI